MRTEGVERLYTRQRFLSVHYSRARSKRDGGRERGREREGGGWDGRVGGWGRGCEGGGAVIDQEGQGGKGKVSEGRKKRER
jgi:hypothetical protein